MKASHVAALLALWEIAWWAKRRSDRAHAYAAAVRRAKALGRPLVVIGSPEGGVTAGYGYGDYTVDLKVSRGAKNSIVADVTKKLPFSDDSVVVFVSCVLEYVKDEKAATKEIHRVAGSDDNVFVIRVEPWTLTAFFYPGAQRILPARSNALKA